MYSFGDPEKAKQAKSRFSKIHLDNLNILNGLKSQYGDNIIDRLDFYDQIYHHHILDIIMKEIEHKENKNYCILTMILVELHKCNLTNHLIESFSEQTKKIALWHETLHILSDAYNLKMNEEQVKFMTHALIAFVEDNPSCRTL